MGNGVEFEHKELAEGRWGEIPFNLQMGNIGSEVSRSLKWQEKHNERRMNAAIDRALELFDLSIKFNTGNHAKLKEVCRAREEFCDYFFGENYFQTDPRKMQRYFDQFVTMSLR
ncbi:hypothetical protein IKF94_02895 [Candidatus Saccharibacteria bacterium]|nr:hypothetical protein [Candidatus Saccharibacteria bacterium]